MSGGAEKQYREFLDAGRFMIQRGKKTGRHVFYPRMFEPGTGDELEWVEACGRGVVYAVSVIHPKPPKEPYNVVLVDLEEGPRMTARVDGVPPEDVAIGLKVRAKIIRERDIPVVVFEPA